MTPEATTYTTDRGIRVLRTVEDIAVEGAIDQIIDALDTRRGALFASSFEYPGRYTRWDVGFVDPLLELSCRGREVSVTALNRRGRQLLPVLADVLAEVPDLSSTELRGERLTGVVEAPSRRFPEEARSLQPSVFSVIRALTALFRSDADPHLGLYGAFGYDLAFQFEPIRLTLERPANQRDLVLYLPDEIVVVDHQRQRASRRRYELEAGARSTRGLPREGDSAPYVGVSEVARSCDHGPGEYAAGVLVAKEAFGRGDLFEVVPGQTFFEPCTVPPSELFRRLRERNPAPYGFIVNLGQSDHLVGASPEMYVRVDGPRVETCPISGTIARGRDPMDDAERIRALLNSSKDESELTMCTDVDRNDKSRICEPGSVRVIGRRQIEIYSRVIHTVDHVEGTLRPGFDALDAFLSHMWAVTVTGAPKAWAMQFIEDHEKTPRAWYGGAVGWVGFDGRMNTGLTLRTVRVRNGVAEVRVGATLLWESDPEAEELETRDKAAAFLDAVRQPRPEAVDGDVVEVRSVPSSRVLLVDHQDSFVHTLANYLRQGGADVTTLRAGFPLDELDRLAPDLVVLSPGPGRPEDFDCSATIAACLARGLPVFGVCLGLQALVEHLGGKLDTLATPTHGKPSVIRVVGGQLLAGLPERFTAGRYHSLHAPAAALPPGLMATALSEDGVVMAVEHVDLPVAGVQFHPESIMSAEDDVGIRLVRGVVARLGRRSAVSPPSG
ncbi:MAG TPA: anthranilate synthase component I [Acidimicrobiales bacterium]|nr:anthranilate synthase component I [Acidimicrobiales bacterium]